MALKDNLKRLREQAGYSNGKELADTLGIAYPRYMTYERGSWPNEETLTRIATTLHVSMDDLLGYHVDDFDKAAALFHEATGETATLSGDQVAVTRNVAGQKWTQSIKKDTFVNIINECVDVFNSTVRPPLLRASFLDTLDKVYMKENFTDAACRLLFDFMTDKDETQLRNSITDIDESANQYERNTREAIFKRLFISLFDKYRPTIEQQLKREQSSQATPPAPDHDDADDKPATEKGPHSKE